MSNEFNSEELISYYNKSMEIIDNYYVVYRADNPVARLVIPKK